MQPAYLTLTQLNASMAEATGTPKALRQLDALLTVEHPSSRYAKRGSRWDGNVHFLKAPRNLFPAGFMARIERAFTKAGHLVHVTTLSPALPKEPPAMYAANGDMLTTRPYQHDAYQAIVSRGRAVIQAGTGGGKSLIGGLVAGAMTEPVLWLVHSKDLATQTRKALREYLREPIGLVGMGVSEPQRITVAMVQTINEFSSAEFWSAWRALVIDECQHASADTWFACALRCVNAYIRVGLSGTPKTGVRLRDAKLEGAVGGIVKIASAKELADSGYIPHAKIILLQVPEQSYPTYENIRDTLCPDWRRNPRQIIRANAAKMYQSAYENGIMRNGARNALIARTAAAHVNAGRKILILFQRIDHGRILADAVRAELKSEKRFRLVDGSDPPGVRLGAVRWLSELKTGGVLLASRIFDQGIDMPAIDAGINAGAGKSDIDTLQRLGRTTRGTQAVVYFYDFLDGHTKAKKDHLRLHTLARIRAYNTSGFTVETKGVWQ